MYFWSFSVLFFEIKTKNGLISKLIDFVLKLLAVFKTTPSPDPILAKMSFFKSLSFSKSLISSFFVSWNIRRSEENCQKKNGDNYAEKLLVINKK